MSGHIVVEMLGQACMALRAGDVEVVCDPWILREAQLGSWLPYPPRTPARVQAQIVRIDAATHIFLSHDHADHFDPELLGRPRGPRRAGPLAPRSRAHPRSRHARGRRPLVRDSIGDPSTNLYQQG